MNKNDNAILILGVRSALNVGAITRSAVAFRVGTIFVAEGTPYPEVINDTRLPHVRRGATAKIAKTALGAERHLVFKPVADSLALLHDLADTYQILALEQADTAITLDRYIHTSNKPWLLIVGHETAGIPAAILEYADTILEIPHSTLKESLNVSVATGIALFWLQRGAD